MTTAAKLDRNDRRVKTARRELANFRAFVNRQDTTGWVDRNASSQYRRTFAAIVVLEDAYGVDAVADLADRMTAIRMEAMRVGLLDAGDVSRAESEAVASVDRR